tara:strand:- start:4287 stop:5531 length:1245 start_codon:yes stop_codon:yes gene_type:complete
MFFNSYHHLKKKEIYLLTFIILFSVVIRIPVIFTYGDLRIENEWGYLYNNLVTHGQLVYENLDGFLLPNLWMPPLYAYYIYFFSFFTSEEATVTLLVLYSQIFLSSLSVVIFYKLNEFFFSKKISFYSALLFSIFPIYLYSCSQISSITLQVFLTLSFLYFFFQFIKEKNFLSIFLFSFTGGLLILLRGEFYVIFFLSIIYLIIFFKISIRNILAILLITLITTSPYLIRNYVIFEKVTIIKSFGYNLWKGNHPYALEKSLIEGAEIVDEKLQKQMNEIPKDKFYRFKYDKIFLEEAIENIKKEPLGYMSLIIRKSLSFLLIDINSPSKNYYNPLNYIPLLLIGLTSLIGIIFSDKKSYKLNYLILILIAYVGIFSTVSVLPRYKLIILPLQIIFTNVLIVYIKKKFFDKLKDN